jgi:N-sulfoglucosamine sulfohydrolase
MASARDHTKVTTTMIRFILFLACLCGSLSAAPNFVWIIADDLSPDLTAYGAKGISTPNLDRLAAEGRRYDRAYATAPVCSASRSAFILGCYQTTTGLHPHDVEIPQPLPAPYVPIPTLFQKAGWFVTNAPAPGSPSKKGKTHYNFIHDAKTLFDSDEWRERAPDQPFFAQFQIKEPHRPFPFPEAYDEAALEAIKLPANYPEHPLMRRDWYAYERSVEVIDQRVGAILNQLEDEGVLDDTYVMFFGDHGRPMPWGKQWLNVEGLQVPLLIRGPGIENGGVEKRLVSLIDLAPSMLQLADLPVPDWMEGKAILGADFPEREVIFAARDRCGDAMDRIRAVIGPHNILVQNFYPALTRLNWSGYKEAAYPGMPLLRVLKTEDKLDDLQAEWLQSTRAEFEFYDLKTDPQGIHDLSQNANRSEEIAAMRTKLDAWIKSSGDQGAAGDPTTEKPLAKIQKDKRANYQRTWKKRLKNSEPTDAERMEWWMSSYGIGKKSGRSADFGE